MALDTKAKRYAVPGFGFIGIPAAIPSGTVDEAGRHIIGGLTDLTAASSGPVDATRYAIYGFGWLGIPAAIPSGTVGRSERRIIGGLVPGNQGTITRGLFTGGSLVVDAKRLLTGGGM